MRARKTAARLIALALAVFMILSAVVGAVLTMRW